MSFKSWKISLDISNQEYVGNELLAKELAAKGYDAIISEYVYIYPDKVKRIFELILGSMDFTGVGVDLGSGVGCISAVAAQDEKVEKVYSLEIVKSVVALCQPIVINKILGDKSAKVISVVGDFDNIELADNSVDFAVSWFSMHHSNDLKVTLKECLRVLKPGGRFVIVDRAHNDATPDTEIQRMLNIVYSQEFITRNYRPAGTILTRQQNGEHEYRFREWENYFERSGFKMISSIVIKTDTPENKGMKNDHGINEIFTSFKIGGFGDRAVGYVLKKG